MNFGAPARRPFLALFAALLTATLAPGWSGAQTPNATEAAPGDPERVVIPITDSDWSTPTTTSDCATGMADDTWELTLSQARQVTISADDCCCPGDYFEVFVNGNQIGVTPNLAPPWGCDSSGPLSSGSFAVPLCPGPHTITVRDAGFDGHSLDEILEQGMCPAGFTVSGTLASLPPTTPVVLGDSSYRYRPARPPLDPKARQILRQLDQLTPFLTTDSRGLLYLDAQEARRRGVRPSTLQFGHEVVSLTNRVVIAALHGEEAKIDAAEFAALEPFFLYLAGEGHPCGDTDHPTSCPARAASGLCFASRAEVLTHLLASGFHQTADYAGGSRGQDYTRPANYPGCAFAGAFRTHAIIHPLAGMRTYSLQGPEPNPEFLSYDDPYLVWPAYVAWWHLEFC